MSRTEVWLKPSKSPYTLLQKIRMATWWFVEALLFRPSLHKMVAWRNMLLRIFGAKIGKGSSVHQKAKIWFPWNLEMGENSSIAFDSLIYSLDKVVIGDFVSVSHRVHVNTGSHDYSDPCFALKTSPVTIGSGSFIGTDVFINMGVTVGDMVVVGARSVVVKDLPANMICFGHPCRPVKLRVRTPERGANSER